MEESPSYTHIVTVTESDIDELGHANNVAYVRWVQDAAVAHSEAVGLGYAGYVKLGGVFVIRRHEIDYLRSALRGDRLAVRTRISSVAAAQCQRSTTVTREADATEVARAVTTITCVRRYAVIGSRCVRGYPVSRRRSVSEARR